MRILQSVRNLKDKVHNGISDFLDTHAPYLSKVYDLTTFGMLGNLRNSAKDADRVSSDDGHAREFAEYLSGLFSSVGDQNQENREYNSAEAALNRQFQHDEAQIERDWYESMSNSAYQRSVADMKAAGINPILAYAQGGASTSSTGIATGSAASYNVGGGDSLSDIMSGIADLVSSFGASASKVRNIYNNVYNIKKK